MHCSLLNLTLSQRLKTHLSIPHEGANVLALTLMVSQKKKKKKVAFYLTESRKCSSVVLIKQNKIIA